jgi:hypothetical protein
MDSEPARIGREHPHPTLFGPLADEAARRETDNPRMPTPNQANDHPPPGAPAGSKNTRKAPRLDWR